MPNIEDMLDEKQVAEKLHLAPRTLVKWRSEKKGPPFYKVGRNALYDINDINKWLLNQRVKV
jgi:hypothetical protein